MSTRSKKTASIKNDNSHDSTGNTNTNGPAMAAHGTTTNNVDIALTSVQPAKQSPIAEQSEQFKATVIQTCIASLQKKKKKLLAVQDELFMKSDLESDNYFFSYSFLE